MGNQKNLLMIHGLLGSIAYFSPAQYLSDTSVHTPDLIGYGGNRSVSAGQRVDIRLQAAEVAHILREQIGQPTWLLGHSVGGAIAMLVADLVPELVLGLISVEGNFTLKDAFWCARIAVTAEADWVAEYRQMTADAAAWLARSGIDATPERTAWANAILDNQPHTTIKAMACSVIEETGSASYLQLVRSVIDRGIPLYLLAGERSAGGWDVPAWVASEARKYVIQPQTGHMMMLENPAEFCRIVASFMDEPRAD
jgi:pimeloyl-ACP methyl ester carboxylesterase